MTRTEEKPIVEIRAVNFTWMAEDGIELRVNFRIECRRQGETEWIRIPVVETGGKPDD